MEITLNRQSFKKALGVFLVVALFFGMCSPAAPFLPKVSFEVGAISDNVVTSGNCGAEASFKFYDDGTLVVSGSGEMNSFQNFAKRQQVKSVIIEEGITFIPKYGFQWFENMKSIYFPESLKAIGPSAFSQSYSLENVIIPEGVSAIGYGAFSSCSSLKSITILNYDCMLPDVEFRGYFMPCSVVVYGHENSTAQELAYRNGNEFAVFCYHNNTEEFEAIPSGCYEIGYTAGEKCIDCGCWASGHKKMMPAHNDGNGDGVCDSCEKVVPEKSGGCGGNKTYYDEMDGGYYYDAAARYYLYADGTLEIFGEGTIYTSKFQNNQNIKRVIVYDGIELIYTDESQGRMAFSGCKNLKSVELADSVIGISYYAFYGCSNLESIKLSAKLRYIGSGAFENCTSLKSIEIPDSVTEISWDTFKGCTSLESVKFNEGLESISNEAFNHCYSLKKAILPSTVKTIGSSAFNDCIYLEEVTIPKSVTSIGSGLFTNCIRLSKVTVMNPDCEIRYAKETLPEKAIIYGYSESTAEKYATDWMRKFVPLDREHDHEFESKLTLKPTCSATGTEEYTCYCGESYTEVVPANSHFDINKDDNCDMCGVKLNAFDQPVKPDEGEDGGTTEAPEGDSGSAQEPEEEKNVFEKFFESLIEFFKNFANLFDYFKNMF